MTLDLAHFRERDDASSDPYGLADRWYEARKYALSLALLPRHRYGTASEPGCSIGVLTARLAARGPRLLSWDAVPDAVASARSRTASMPGVLVEQHVVPGEWPDFTAEAYTHSGGDLRSVAQADGIV